MMKEQMGWKIIAVIKGDNLKIDLKDNNMQVIMSADGDICKKVKEKYWVMEDEQP